MKTKAITAIGLASLLGCSSQEEEKMDYSNMTVTSSYEIENNGCANVVNIGMVCYKGINETGDAILEIISGDAKQFAYKISPAVYPLLDNEERTATFTMSYVSDSRIKLNITQKKKEEKKKE